MGRPVGTKNVMRTAEEKAKIIEEYYLLGQAKICHKYNISKSVLWSWIKKYEEQGLNGLKTNTGKHKNKNSRIYFKKPKNKIEELELEIMKKDIEIARLKKGYIVKGVGAEKEYVTTLDKNTK